MPAFTPDDTEKLILQLKRSEGLRLAAYHCPAGVLTIGYGHNCEAAPVPGVAKAGDRITPEQAEALFAADLAKAMHGLRKALPWVEILAPARQAVLCDMAFNLGLSGLLGFVHTLSLVRDGNYAAAARGMLQSRWAGQVGRRAKRLARQMEEGEWQCV